MAARAEQLAPPGQERLSARTGLGCQYPQGTDQTWESSSRPRCRRPTGVPSGAPHWHPGARAFRRIPRRMMSLRPGDPQTAHHRPLVPLLSLIRPWLLGTSRLGMHGGKPVGRPGGPALGGGVNSFKSCGAPGRVPRLLGARAGAAPPPFEQAKPAPRASDPASHPRVVR